MASLTRWTWVWVSSRSWWWTGKPGMLQSMGLQRIGHDWVTELNWTTVHQAPLSMEFSRQEYWSRLCHSLLHDKPRQHIKKQRYHFAKKGLSSQSYGFSCSHVWMWELDHKKSWAQKNCWRRHMNPLDCKIKPVNSKGNQSLIFIARTDAEAETSILWPLDVKNWFNEKDLDAGKELKAGKGDDRE